MVTVMGRRQPGVDAAENNLKIYGQNIGNHVFPYFR
ncbi:hypothetical protein KCO_10380 [Pectobacterium brasiliense ICMP 19477]|nr:hypothetical protein KCO_10380 [Pectobacterium brasiliense ICMP 19477]